MNVCVNFIFFNEEFFFLIEQRLNISKEHTILKEGIG